MRGLQGLWVSRWVSISSKHDVGEISAVLLQACCFFFIAGPI